MHQSTVLALVALSAMTMALPVSVGPIPSLYLTEDLLLIQDDKCQTIDGVPGGESDSPAVKRGTVEVCQHKRARQDHKLTVI